MTRPLIVYHGNCADGFSAAWVCWKYFNGDADFHAGVYGATPPDCTGREVIMVDFSYKKPVLEIIALAAQSILILDHHKTALEDLADYAQEVPQTYEGWVSAWAKRDDTCLMSAIFDMNRSGATITWDFFFPYTPRPALLNHIEDRDLWLFKLEGTREIQANVFSYPYDFETWDRLMASDPVTMISEGAAIERKHHKDVAELVGVCRRSMVIGGYLVPVANMPYTLASDAGHVMAKGVPFAATYFDKLGKRIFGLRSALDGVDVSEIAKLYGGGGHAHAAGFEVEAGWEGSPL